MNIGVLLQRQAEERPNAAALIDTWRGVSRHTSYADLERMAGRGATLLSQAGLRAGDIVLVLAPMSPELYAALAAIFRLGLVAMVPDPSVSLAELNRCCQIAHPTALIASAKLHLLRAVSPALRRIKLKWSLGRRMPGAMRWDALDRCEYQGHLESVDDDAPALMTFTSGTTAEPKPVVRTHGFLAAQYEAIRRALELAPGEVELVTLPIFVFANLATGVTSLIPDVNLRQVGSIDASRVVGQIEKHGPQRMAASPAFCERIAEHCLSHGTQLSGLEKIFTGGGPVSPRLLGQLTKVAPHAEVVAVYGATEAEPIARVARSEIAARDIVAMNDGAGLLAGAPVPEIELHILPNRWPDRIRPLCEAEFQRLCCPAGEPGEIVVSGRHVLSGYLDDKDGDIHKFQVDGTCWHRTGDAGYLDAQGRLWLLGRCSARVSDAHGTLYPFTVEQIALSQPGVRRAALALHRGQRLLVVETNRRLTDADLESMKYRLDRYCVERIHVVRQLPMDRRHNAKVDYRALVRLLERTACPTA